jgi:hypothetical protein
MTAARGKIGIAVADGEAVSNRYPFPVLKTSSCRPKGGIFIFLVGMLLFLLSACKGFLEDNILDQTTLDTYLTKDTEAVAFLYGSFHFMRDIAFGQNYLSVYELVNDQTCFHGSDESRRQIARFDYYANSTFVQNVWGALYKVIGQMNILIDHLENGTLKNSVYAPRIIAQARFLRAYCYFDAVRLWGPAPITRAYYNTSGDIKPVRSPVQDVYKQIVDDLRYGLEENRLRDFGITSAGAKMMPDTVKFKYPDDTDAFASRYFLPVSNGAAQLLLAKVYLTRNAAGDNQLAEELVDDLIGKSRINGGELYDLLPDYGDLFEVNTKTAPHRFREVLFELEAQTDVGNNTTYRQICVNRAGANQGIKQPANSPNNDIRGVNASGYGYYRPTEYFLSTFDGMKDRRYFWLFQFAREENGPCYQKGRDIVTTHNDNGYCNAVLLRFADAFLIKAELRARANDAAGVKAAIDPVLTRAGLDPYNVSGKTQAQMIDDILTERAKEFALEAGNRMFDMRRTGFKTAMDKYEAWYDENVENSDRIFPYSGLQGRKTYMYMNPAAKGNPDMLMMDDPDRPGNQIPNPRQDQRIGGDFFEIPVPFVTSYDGFEKKYLKKAEWHPIPTRELMQNPNLDNNMNLSDWN